MPATRKTTFDYVSDVYNAAAIADLDAVARRIKRVARSRQWEQETIDGMAEEIANHREWLSGGREQMEAERDAEYAKEAARLERLHADPFYRELRAVGCGYGPCRI